MRLPASRPAQTGAQAGHGPEVAGLLAGPGRAPGRHDRGGAVVTDGDGAARGEVEGELEEAQRGEELTLGTLVHAVEEEVAEIDGNKLDEGAAVVGEEVIAGGDSGPPELIPCAERERARRRSDSPTSIWRGRS